MICSKYQELSHREKVEFIGKLVHAVQSHDALFESSKALIDCAEMLGLFKNVTILPENETAIKDLEEKIDDLENEIWEQNEANSID